MPKAIRVHQHGGPEVLRFEEISMPKPGAGEALIKHHAIGLNFIDVYYRTGLYKAEPPFTPGMEASGVIEAVGPGVEHFAAGDRVAYGKGPLGAYAEYRVLAQENLIKVPKEISFEHAAGAMLKGLTAHYLLRRTFDVKPGITILVWAASGGVGLFLCQWASALGARVIGAVGSEEKAAFAKQNGCEFPILHKKEDVVKRVKEITGGLGCNVVYDSVGQASFMQSLDCLMPFGLLVSYGQSSGPIPPFDLSILSQKGSLFLTRPSLMHYKKDQKEYILGAAELFDMILKGAVKVHIGQTYYLSDAATAHRDLEAGRTKGSTVMLPG